jgi:hypothetical protein
MLQRRKCIPTWKGTQIGNVKRRAELQIQESEKRQMDMQTPGASDRISPSLPCSFEYHPRRKTIRPVTDEGHVGEMFHA